MKTILQIAAGRVVVVLRETEMGRAIYVVENDQRFNERSVCVATSRPGVLAAIDALKTAAEGMS